MSCPVISRTWFGSSLSLRILEQLFEDFSDWLQDSILYKDEDTLVQILSTTYGWLEIYVFFKVRIYLKKTSSEKLLRVLIRFTKLVRISTTVILQIVTLLFHLNKTITRIDQYKTFKSLVGPFIFMT